MLLTSRRSSNGHLWADAIKTSDNGCSSTNGGTSDGNAAKKQSQKQPKKTKEEIEASKARKEKAFDILQEILRNQDQYNISAKNGAAPKTFAEAYQLLRSAEFENKSDPLSDHGIAPADFEQMAALYRNDPLYLAHWEMLLMAMSLPCAQASPNAKVKKNGSKKNPVNGQKKSGKWVPKK